MKLSLIVLMALVLTACIWTKITDADLCLSSPQKTNNQIKCKPEDINYKD